VRCTAGAIFDVIVDLRESSPTRHRWVGFELSAENRRALFVPKDFAHGFLTLADDSEVLYMISVPYAPGFERGVRWNDLPSASTGRSRRCTSLRATRPIRSAAERRRLDRQTPRARDRGGRFIGRASIDPLLAAGFEVHAVLSPEGPAGNPAPAAGCSRVQVRRADLLDLGCDRFAGRGGPAEPLAAFRLDRDSRRVLAERGESPLAGRLANAVALVSATRRGACGDGGSCAEYDWSRAGVCNEATSPLAQGAVTPYAACKIALQRRLDEFAAAHACRAPGGGFLPVRPGEPRQRLVASVIHCAAHRPRGALHRRPAGP